MLTLEERIARLEKQTHVVSVHADSNSAALMADIPDEVRVWKRRCLISILKVNTPLRLP